MATYLQPSFPFPRSSLCFVNTFSELGLCNIHPALVQWNPNSTSNIFTSSSLSVRTFSWRDSNIVTTGFRASRYLKSTRFHSTMKPLLIENQERSKDYREAEIHGHPQAQPSVVDMFLRGNASYNMSNSKSGADYLAQAGENRKDEGVSRIMKNSELGASMEKEGYLDSKAGTQFFKGEGNKLKQNEMKDGFQETTIYEKDGARGKQRSEADFLDLAMESSSGDMDMVGQESAAAVGRKPSEGGTQLTEKSLVVNSEDEVKLRKQVVKRSSVIAKQVISKTSALSMGFVTQLWVDTNSWIVQMMEIRPSLLSGEMERFFLKDLCQVGDVILVEDENVLENDLTMIGLDTLVGYNIITEDKYSLGKIRDYKFNINLGNVAYLEFDSFGVPLIPPSLVSTYCLLVDDVIEVTSDTIVVRSGADVRVQRLTKGLWEASNLHAQVWNDAVLRKSNLNSKEYERQISMDDELERRFNQLSKNYYSNKGMSKRSAFKESNAKDEWGPPLDY